MNAAFRESMKRLSGLRFAPVSLDGHWSVLKAIPATVLDAAVTHALAAQSEFPSPHELLVYCDLVTPAAPVGIMDEDRAVPMASPVEFSIPQSSKRVRITREWRYDCEGCGDGGMVSYWCDEPGGTMPTPWYHRRACERKAEHAAHEWVGPCPCVATNPTIQRRMAARAKYATAAPAERRRGA